VLAVCTISSVRYSPANRLLIAGKLARKIRRDKPVSDLPGRDRAWLLGQRGAIAELIICELPGNCARIYFLAEGANGVPAPTIYLQFLTEATAAEWGSTN